MPASIVSSTAIHARVRGQAPRCRNPAHHSDATNRIGAKMCEIFSGSGHLNSRFAAHGIPAEGWDIQDGTEADILRVEVQDRIKRNIDEGQYAIMHFGFPCITWSRARKHDNKGPPPLRGDNYCEQDYYIL